MTKMKGGGVGQSTKVEDMSNGEGVTEIEGNVELKSRANFTDIVRKRESGSFRLQSLNSELPYMMTI